MRDLFKADIDPTGPERYLLRKRDLWWRPDGRGYTSVLAAAGTYSAREAYERAAFPGTAYPCTTAVPLSDVHAQLVAQRDRLTQMIDEAAAPQGGNDAPQGR